MIAEILPEAAIAVEMRSDPADVILFPEEEAVVRRAVEKRRREFATARSCARQALGVLGFPPLPIPAGPRGEPCWPSGVVGSITHCNGYRACAVARATQLMAIGIDAEPNRALPEGVLGAVASAGEVAALHQLAHVQPEVNWDRLLFSAKESIYKACFPLGEHALGFADAVLDFVPRQRAFSARVQVSGPASMGGLPRTLSGRWLLRDGLVLTAIVIANPPSN